MPVALNITRPEDFFIPDQMAFPDYNANSSPWKNFPTAMVIFGGGGSKLTTGSVKRKFEELIQQTLSKKSIIDIVRGTSIPLTFYKEELSGDSPNATIPLLIRAQMVNFDVRHILVNQGSSVDIMYLQLYSTLQVDETHLTPYVGSDL